jgi:hypothetical protein
MLVGEGDVITRPVRHWTRDRLQDPILRRKNSIYTLNNCELYVVPSGSRDNFGWTFIITAIKRKKMRWAEQMPSMEVRNL